MRCRRGASLAEFAILLPLLLLFVFGALEIGYLMWQVQQGGVAAKKAVRIATTRALIAPGAIPDCGPATPATAIAGTKCSTIADYSLWATCRGDGTGSAACGPDIARVATEVRRFYPAVAQEDIVIEISGGGMGFVGLGRPVPVVTVRFENVQFEFITLGGLAGLANITMPSMSASAAAEDLQNGVG
jgi:hypothetical protein